MQRKRRHRVKGDVLLPALAHAGAGKLREVQNLGQELVVLSRGPGETVCIRPAKGVAAVRRRDLRRLIAEGALRDEVHALRKRDPPQPAQRAGGQPDHGLAAQARRNAQLHLRAGIAGHDRVAVVLAQGVAPVSGLLFPPQLGHGQRKSVQIRPRFRVGARRFQEIPVQLRLRYKADKHGYQQEDRDRTKYPSVHGCVSSSVSRESIPFSKRQVAYVCQRFAYNHPFKL